MHADADVIRVAVIRYGGEWRVLRDGQDTGHFDYSVDAVEAALHRAAALIQKGRTVEVLVQDHAGQLRRVDTERGEVIN